MRWFRIRLVILGLLLFVVHVGAAAGGTAGETACDTRYTDPISSAILADVVIEGRVKSRPPGKEDRYNSSIQVRKFLKGQALVNGGQKNKKIKVGVFGPLDKTQCVSEVTYNKKYIFFLRVSLGNGDYFLQSALPVEAKKKTVRSIKKIVCKNCAKAPVIKKLANQRKKVGQKIRIRCQVKAKPRAAFLWFKDGLQITLRKGLRIKSGKRSSRLEIRRAKMRDSGVYMCQATNAVGDSNVSVNLEIEEAMPHYPKCKSQTYCLNGGMCRYIVDLNKQFCVCPEAYAGRRCELQDIFSLEPAYIRQAKLLHDRTLIIIGIVLAILIFIAICIISYYLAKRQRKKFEARRLSRNIPRQTRGHYHTLDEVDHGHHRFTTQSCKDKCIQTDHSLAELSPSRQVAPDNGTINQPHVFSMEQSFPPMSKQDSGQQQQANPNVRRSSSRGSRTRLKAVSLDEADEPNSIPMTEMPRSLQSEGSIHDVVRRKKHNRYDREPAAVSEPLIKHMQSIESSDPVVAGMDAGQDHNESFSDSLDGLSDDERHLFTDNTTAEHERMDSDGNEAQDVELPLLSNKKDSFNLDTDSEDQMEETTFTPLHISEEKLHHSSGSSLDTGYDRSRDPEYLEDAEDSGEHKYPEVQNYPVDAKYPEGSRHSEDSRYPENYSDKHPDDTKYPDSAKYPENSYYPDAPTPESDLPVKPDIYNHLSEGRTAGLLPNGPQHPIVVSDGGSDSNYNPESSDRSGTSLTGSQDSMNHSTSGASSQVPTDADNKLAWDENGTPVSTNYALTAAMDDDDDPLSYMHQEVPDSPSKKKVCNRLLKDLCEDQGPIQI